MLGADVGGESTLTYTWAATTPPSGAPAPTFSDNTDNTAKNTTATFSAAGTYDFTVTITDAVGLSVTSSVSVTVGQTLTSITLSPASASLDATATQQFTATGYDQFGAALQPQPTFTWTTSVGVISTAGAADGFQRFGQRRCDGHQRLDRQRRQSGDGYGARADALRAGQRVGQSRARHDDQSLGTRGGDRSGRRKPDLRLGGDDAAQRGRGADLQCQRQQRGAEHYGHLQRRRGPMVLR